MAIDSPIILVGDDENQINVSVNYTNEQSKATSALVMGGPTLISDDTAYRHITTKPAPSHTHEYVVPVYILNYGFDCYWCKLPSHVGSIYNTDFICGNYGSSKFATIAAYICISCESKIDVKDYHHTCDWQAVYGIADIDRCNYCGEEGFTTFVDDDTRFGDASANVTFRQVHENNDCVAKCKAEHPDWDESPGKFFGYLLEKNSREEYISYYQCSKCSRIKNDTDPIMTLTVEGKQRDIPLQREHTDWTGLDGTEWIFETLDDLDLTGSETRTLSPYLPIFGIYLFKTYPDSMNNYTEVSTYPCPLCGETLKIDLDIGDMMWKAHTCE